MEEALRGAAHRARRGGWCAWGAVRADFERALADPAIATAEIASELRRGADYVQVTIALTVLSTDVADALTIAWDAFRGAARDGLAGWEVARGGLVPRRNHATAARSQGPARGLRRHRWSKPGLSPAGWPQREERCRGENCAAAASRAPTRR